METRFDLEQQIMQCWCVVDDIRVVLSKINDMNDDKREVTLEGLASLYDVKFDVMFNTFEKMIAENQTSVIDKSAAKRIATQLGWQPPASELNDAS